jgi:ribosomal protein L17
MAGGAAKYRHLSRKSSHRQALLRNLVTSLFKHESITTTWPKAKEAQRLAEKLITLGKKNTEASRKSALQIFFVSTLKIQGGMSQLGCTSFPAEQMPDKEFFPSTIRHRTNFYQSCSVHFVKDMQTDQVAILEFSVLNRKRTIKLLVRFWNWSTDPRT